MSTSVRRWLRPFLRAGGLQSRPLQIDEILDAAEQHLVAESLPGLSTRFLPTQLSVAVSYEDLRSLRPFEDELTAEVQAMASRLAERPSFQPLTDVLEVDLTLTGELSAGSSPRLKVGFPRGRKSSSWHPGQARFAPRHAASEEPVASDGVWLELTLTRLSADGVTALQSLALLSLEPTLPAAWMGGPATEGLEVADDGSLRLTGTGEVWTGPLPALSDVVEPIPEPLEKFAGRVLYRFLRSSEGSADVLWVPEGVLIVGRCPERAHWAPMSAPPNLSGRHLALGRTVDGGLRVMDLASTNGTFVEGHRLPPMEWEPMSMPGGLEVGSESSLRIDWRNVCAHIAMTRHPEPSSRDSTILDRQTETSTVANAELVRG